MDNRNEVREFLASRRARLAPAQVDLPAATFLFLDPHSTEFRSEASATQDSLNLLASWAASSLREST